MMINFLNSWLIQLASPALTPIDNLTTPVGPEGGTHTNSDGTVEVVIPQGALAQVEEISTTRLSSSKALPGDLNETTNLEYPIGFLFCLAKAGGHRA